MFKLLCVKFEVVICIRFRKQVEVRYGITYPTCRFYWQLTLTARVIVYCDTSE